MKLEAVHSIEKSASYLLCCINAVIWIFWTVQQHNGTNYDALVAAEYVNVIENTEPFECVICFTDIDPECGIVLRDCLHMFCRSDTVNFHSINVTSFHSFYILFSQLPTFYCSSVALILQSLFIFSFCY